jgi:hypothetical protein
MFLPNQFNKKCHKLGTFGNKNIFCNHILVFRITYLTSGKVFWHKIEKTCVCKSLTKPAFLQYSMYCTLGHF